MLVFRDAFDSLVCRRIVAPAATTVKPIRYPKISCRCSKEFSASGLVEEAAHDCSRRGACHAT